MDILSDISLQENIITININIINFMEILKLLEDYCKNDHHNAAKKS
jgi:hypothetical protein